MRARLIITAFQSPRSGKFVSDTLEAIAQKEVKEFKLFQSPRSGKFVSDFKLEFYSLDFVDLFQSPRSGKFVSDSPKNDCSLTMSFKRTTLCRHYITNGKMFENVAKKIFQIRTLLLIDSLR